MILEHPKELNIKLKKGLKQSLKKFLITALIQNFFVMSGGFIFLYIEQCYHQTSPKQPSQQIVAMDTINYEKLCEGLQQHLNSTHREKNISNVKNADNSKHYKLVLQGKIENYYTRKIYKDNF